MSSADSFVNQVSSRAGTSSSILAWCALKCDDGNSDDDDDGGNGNDGDDGDRGDGE